MDSYLAFGHIHTQYTHTHTRINIFLGEIFFQTIICKYYTFNLVRILYIFVLYTLLVWSIHKFLIVIQRGKFMYTTQNNTYHTILSISYSF